MLSFPKNDGSKISILNNIIKLDDLYHISIICKLKNTKSENFSFDKDDNLWYFQNYKNRNKLIDILYPDEKITKVSFKNGDFNDYTENNLILEKDIRFINEFTPPKNNKIIENGSSIKIIEGKYAGQYRNMYWEVESKKNYIIMHIKDDIYTKFSKENLKKVLNINNIRPVWYIMENGYVATTLRLEEGQKIYYLHQLILDQHTKDNTDFKNTVDHINQDKLDNRRENLRIVDMSEQNKNKGKQTRRVDAKVDLPIGIKVLPKYIEYRKEIYNKETNKEREFFMVNHPKLDRTWETTKSNKVSISDKLRYAKAKIELIENKITEDQFKEIVGDDDKMDLPLGIRLGLVKNKYHFILDLQKNDQRPNARMVLHSIDVQKELDKFIETVVNIKYPNLMEKYKIENPIDIDEKLISHNEEKDEEEKPTYPQYISVFSEKENKYIQYSRKVKEIKYTKKLKITSNNIQAELDKLVEEINKKFPGYNLSKQIVINPQYFKLKDNVA
jgi:hypothetical protein